VGPALRVVAANAGARIVIDLTKVVIRTRSETQGLLGTRRDPIPS